MIQLTLSNSNSKGPRILFKLERDLNYRESFISVSNLKGPKNLFELEREIPITEVQIKESQLYNIFPAPS